MNNEEFNEACSCIDMFDLFLTFFDNINISKEKLLVHKIAGNDDYRIMLYELMDFLNAVYTYKEFLTDKKYGICNIVHETYYNFDNDKGNNYRFLLEYRNILIHDHLIPRFYTENGYVVLNTNKLRKYLKDEKKKKHLDSLIKKVYEKSDIKIGEDYILLFEIVSTAFEEITAMFHEIAFRLYDSKIEDELEIFIKGNKDKNVDDIEKNCSYILRFFGVNSYIGKSVLQLLKNDEIILF